MNNLWIGFGGTLGAVARYTLGSFLHGLMPKSFPWSTLLINLLGCFVLGLFLTATQNSFRINPQLKLAFSIGFVGAFTTFSTFSVETVQLINSGHWISGLIYVFASCFLGIGLAFLGVCAGRLNN